MSSLTVLKQLLAPLGIKAVTTGKELLEDYFIRRYGEKEQNLVDKQFERELTNIQEKNIALIGMPSDNGAGWERGSKMGPMYIKSNFLNKEGVFPSTLVDIGDVLDHPLLIHDSLVQEWVIDSVLKERGLDTFPEKLPVSPHSILKRVIEEVLTLNPSIKPLILGGDHSLSYIPIEVLALKNPHMGIVHFDAHTDLLETRQGLPYSYATWAYHANETIQRGKKLIQIGIRASQKPKSYWEKELDIIQYRAEDCMRLEPKELALSINNHFQNIGVENFYLSLDIDVLSKELAGATGTPESYGLTVEYVKDCIHYLKFPCIGADLVEVAPPLSRGNEKEPKQTLDAAHTLLKALINRLNL